MWQDAPDSTRTPSKVQWKKCPHLNTTDLPYCTFIKEFEDECHFLLVDLCPFLVILETNLLKDIIIITGHLFLKPVNY